MSPAAASTRPGGGERPGGERPGGEGAEDDRPWRRAAGFGGLTALVAALFVLIIDLWQRAALWDLPLGMVGIAALSGLIGGCLTWRWLAGRRPAVPVERLIALALVGQLLTLLTHGLALGLLVAVIGWAPATAGDQLATLAAHVGETGQAGRTFLATLSGTVAGGILLGTWIFLPGLFLAGLYWRRRQPPAR